MNQEKIDHSAWNPSEQELKEYKEQCDKVYADIAKAEKEEHEDNMKLLRDNNIPDKDFKELLDFCNVTGRLTIVDKPTGETQDEVLGVFKQVWVDQWSVGMKGDSFEGYIYGQLESGKWLKVPFSC